jgi:hypothetical protein
VHHLPVKFYSSLATCTTSVAVAGQKILRFWECTTLLPRTAGIEILDVRLPIRGRNSCLRSFQLGFIKSIDCNVLTLRIAGPSSIRRTNWRGKNTWQLRVARKLIGSCLKSRVGRPLQDMKSGSKSQMERWDYFTDVFPRKENSNLQAGIFI